MPEDAIRAWRILECSGASLFAAQHCRLPSAVRAELHNCCKRGKRSKECCKSGCAN